VTYQVYAIRYAYRDGRRAEHFYGSIDHPDDPMPLSYYVWLVAGDGVAVVVDTGFTRETAARRGRTYVVAPAEGVRALDIDPGSVGSVVLTHLHYDHAGCAADFDGATYVLQDDEMRFWTGRHAARVGGGLIGGHGLVDPDDVALLCAANFLGRITWVDGDGEVLPGLTVHKVGGHTAGMQVVRVVTEDGPVVLASDATHFYENIRTDRPYSVVDSVPGAHAAFDRVRALADDPNLIIPGHDPAVMDNFPAARADLEGIVARIA
jgi:glyoxylase-like metal-dependent hydrolase (beta-lactamase superfamily II)